MLREAGAIDELRLPNDFNYQHKHPEPDDKTDRHNRDDGLRLSLRLFSCGGRSLNRLA
jgi:hypothetical protein